jgi:hypothetical protein
MGTPQKSNKVGLAGMFLLTALLLSLSPAYGGTITENFTNNQYNTQLWELGYQGTGTTATVANNRLEVSVGGGGYAGFTGVGFTLIGDFTMTADYTLFNWPVNNGTQLTMGTFNKSPAELFQVGHANGGISLGSTEWFFTYILNTYTQAGPTVSNPGTLKMVRTGNTMTGYYSFNGGSTWTQIGSAVDDSRLGTPVSVILSIGPFANSYSGIPAQAAFSNIQITYSTLGPSLFGNPGAGIGLLLE